jgi:transcriptional regulator with XRE-family HTH domain
MAKKGTESYEDLLRTLARNVKRLRQLTGLNQQELSRRARLYHNYVGRIENQRTNPEVRSLTKLAKALDVTLVALLSPTSQVPQSKSKRR